MRALYAYAGAALAVAAGLVLAVATRPQFASKNTAAGPPAAADGGLSTFPATAVPAPVPAPVAHSSSYAGKIPRYATGTDWKALAEALPTEVASNSYYLSPIHSPPSPQTLAATGAAIDAASVAGQPVALPTGDDDEATPEATGDTRIDR